MAHTIAQAYDLARAAQRLESAAQAQTLTNNPSASIVAAVDAAVLDVAEVASGSADGASAIVKTGQQLTVPVTGTYVTKATVTVAGGVVTAIALS